MSDVNWLITRSPETVTELNMLVDGERLDTVQLDDDYSELEYVRAKFYMLSRFVDTADD